MNQLCVPSLGSLPPPAPHPSRSSASTELNCLCYTAASPWLSVLPMVVCKHHSPNLSHSPLPPRLAICFNKEILFKNLLIAVSVEKLPIQLPQLTHQPRASKQYLHIWQKSPSQELGFDIMRGPTLMAVILDSPLGEAEVPICLVLKFRFDHWPLQARTNLQA